MECKSCSAGLTQSVPVTAGGCGVPGVPLCPGPLGSLETPLLMATASGG